MCHIVLSELRLTEGGYLTHCSSWKRSLSSPVQSLRMSSSSVFHLCPPPTLFTQGCHVIAQIWAGLMANNMHSSLSGSTCQLHDGQINTASAHAWALTGSGIIHGYCSSD